MKAAGAGAETGVGLQTLPAEAIVPNPASVTCFIQSPDASCIDTSATSPEVAFMPLVCNNAAWRL